jgi:hypothetical protein
MYVYMIYIYMYIKRERERERERESEREGGEGRHSNTVPGYQIHTHVTQIYPCGSLAYPRGLMRGRPTSWQTKFPSPCPAKESDGPHKGLSCDVSCAVQRAHRVMRCECYLARREVHCAPQSSLGHATVICVLKNMSSCHATRRASRSASSYADRRRAARATPHGT